jgi:hypothetical protein
MKMVFIKGKRFYVSQDNDFFNQYDICAKKEGATYWIQVKSHSSDTSHAKPDIKAFHMLHNNDKFELSQIWQRVSRKGFVIYTLNNNTHEWEKDFIDIKGNFCEPFKIN